MTDFLQMDNAMVSFSMQLLWMGCIKAWKTNASHKPNLDYLFL